MDKKKVWSQNLFLEVFSLEPYTDKLDGFPSRLKEQISLMQKHNVSVGQNSRPLLRARLAIAL